MQPETATHIEDIEQAIKLLRGHLSGLAQSFGPAVAVVVNYAAGRAESATGIRLADINVVSRTALARVHRILDFLVTLDGS